MPQQLATKTNGKIIFTFDRLIYSNLLAEISPKAIETPEEYDRLLAVAERLTFAKHLTPEEKALFNRKVCSAHLSSTTI
ncbi:hypothetical protein QUB10_20935 [Microcoleus sp. B5-D4]|uniref:hypothetical protein n=1 Tax=unclassified Microcoleus TaxID=2642155 RepID=UPI002FCF684D